MSLAPASTTSFVTRLALVASLTLALVGLPAAGQAQDARPWVG